MHDEKSIEEVSICHRHSIASIIDFTEMRTGSQRITFEMHHCE